MAADELRRRVTEAIERSPNLTVNAVAERAEIKASTLYKLLGDPGRGVEPDTCRKLAAFFQWPEEDVFRWAGHLSPRPADDPMADLHSALVRGFPEPLAGALWTLASQLQQNAAVEPWRGPFGRAVDRLLDQRFAAGVKGRLGPEELGAILRREFWRLFVEESRRAHE